MMIAFHYVSAWSSNGVAFWSNWASSKKKNAEKKPLEWFQRKRFQTLPVSALKHLFFPKNIRAKSKGRQQQTGFQHFVLRDNALLFLSFFFSRRERGGGGEVWMYRAWCLNYCQPASLPLSPRCFWASFLKAWRVHIIQTQYSTVGFFSYAGVLLKN